MIEVTPLEPRGI